MQPRSRNRVLTAALLVFGIFSGSLRAQSQPVTPVIGQWKMNVAKSSFEPGPPPKSQTRIYEDWGGGLIRATFEGVDAQDKPTFSQFVARYDGKEYPRVNRGSPSAATIALKRVDPHTSEFVQKEDGKVSLSGKSTVSADGRVLTITYKGTNAQGQAISAVQVFDRQ